MIIQGYRAIKLVEKILEEDRLNAIANQLIEKLTDILHLFVLNSPAVNGNFHDRRLIDCDITRPVASKEIPDL